MTKELLHGTSESEKRAVYIIAGQEQAKEIQEGARTKHSPCVLGDIMAYFRLHRSDFCDKILMKSNLGRKEFVWLTHLGCGPSLR